MQRPRTTGESRSLSFLAVWLGLVAASVLAALTLTAMAPAPLLAQAVSQEANQVVSPDRYEGLRYRMIGPYRGGRATAEHGVPGEPLTYYIGTTGGGVWKTTDAGKTWRNISDGFFGGDIGEVTVAPSDPSVIYVGTGSVCIRGNVSQGDGVYKSEDGGRTWEFVGLPDAGQIGRILVHPENPDVAYLAALGRPFGKNDQRGVFKTTDGGDNWENVLFLNDSTGVVDLAMNPERPQEVFAGAWAAEREPWTIQTGTSWNAGGGLWKTTDGGDSWMHLEQGLPSGDTLVGKTAITVSRPNPDRVWAMVQAHEPHGGVYRSDDGGESWTRTNRNRKLRKRSFYYTHIYAHPTDPNTVYALNADMYRSVDGGETFEAIEKQPLHGDQHGLWINPNRPSHMVVANDGGGQVTQTGGESWSIYYNQPTAEHYRVEVDEQWPYHVYAAQQDNSTIRVPSRRRQAESSMQEWRDVGGGESGHVTIQSYGPQIVWATSYGGVITRKNLETGQSPNVVPYPEPTVGKAPKERRYRFQWNAPVEVNPHDSTEVFHAAQKLLRTSDGGHSWTEVSADLTYDDTTKQGPADGRLQNDRTGVEIYNTIFALSFSPHEEGVAWAGTDDGRVWITRRGPAEGNWAEVTPAGLPRWSTVNTIEVSPHDPGTAYVTAYRYRLDDFAPYVYRTEDYGESWVRIADGSRGIEPDHATRVVREDPVREGLLYAGTEYGLYVSFDDGAHWQSLQQNLPDVPVTDLKVHRGDLVVATNGRSLWILDELTPLRQVEVRGAGTDVQLYEPRSAYRRVEDYVDAGDWWHWPENPPRGVVLDYYLTEGADAVTVQILDDTGDVIRQSSNGQGMAPEGPYPLVGEHQLSASVGHHRVHWDLMHDGVTEKPDDVVLWGHTGGYPAAPGTYRARLIADGDTVIRSFDVQVSPGLQGISPGDLEAQASLSQSIRDTMNSLYSHLRRLRGVREQVAAAARNAETSGAPNTIQTAADSLLATVDGLERELIQPKNESGTDPINYPPELDSEFGSVYGVVADGADRPTEGVQQRFDDLLPEWADLRQRIEDFMAGPLQEFNERLRSAGFAGVIVPGD